MLPCLHLVIPAVGYAMLLLPLGQRADEAVPDLRQEVFYYLYFVFLERCTCIAFYAAFAHTG